MIGSLGRSLREKITAKLPATTLSYSIVKIICRKDAFSKSFELEGSTVEGQLLLQNFQKRKKGKAKKVTKPQQVKGCRLLSHPVSKV